MQTTLLGLAITLILALIAALVGPLFIDWNQFRPQFEAEASRLIGTPVRVEGALDARLLPTPTLRLRSVVLGRPADAGKARADKLDVEFSLGDLMRGEWRATELAVNGVAVELGLDSRGRVEWQAGAAFANLGALAIDRLAVTGRIALHDAGSGSSIELNDIAFAGDVRPMAAAIRGDGNFSLQGTRHPFRLSAGRLADGSATRVHLTVDRGERELTLDLDGLLSFEARSPRFDGAMTVAVPPPPAGSKAATEPAATPWRLAGKLKARPAEARFEQIEASYGADDVALKFSGLVELGFGAEPRLHAALSAKQLDVDRLLARHGNGDPLRLLPGLRGLLVKVPPAPMPTQIEVAAEQIMLGGRAIQNVSADLNGTPQAWRVARLELRAPGGSQLALSGDIAQPGGSARFKGAVSLDSADPDLLAGWLLGRTDNIVRAQRPLRGRGELQLAQSGFAIEQLRAEVDGGKLEGRIALSTPPNGGTRFEAALKADRLDLDAANALLRSLAGPQPDWPEQASLTLDLGRAVSGGQTWQPLIARLSYGPDEIALQQMKIGAAGGLMVEGAGAFNRIDSSGNLNLSGTAASLSQLSRAIAPLAPVVSGRLGLLGEAAGPARLKLAVELGKAAVADRAAARAMLEIDAPQLKATGSISSTAASAAIRTLDVEALRRSEWTGETRMTAPKGASLLALLGLDPVLSTGAGPATLDASASGIWGGMLQLKAKLAGAGLDGDIGGSVDPWAAAPSATFTLAIRDANLAPLLDLNPADVPGRVSLSSRVVLAGDQLGFNDIDGSIGGSRLRGRLALTLGNELLVQGEAGIDTLELGPALRLAIGAAARDSSAPLARGLLKGWRGQVGFQAVRGLLPGGSEIQPVSGVIRSDGRALMLDAIKGKIGGGDFKADLDARRSPDGLALNGHVDLAGAEGTSLRFGGLTLPAGRTAVKMAVSSTGRSAAALVGALTGGGAVTIESAKIAGLDPKAFDVTVRASDAGQVIDDAKLGRLVDPALSAGTLPVALAQVPFSLKDGRLSVDKTTLISEKARATVSGGYDLLGQQVDLRVVLAATGTAAATVPPEISIFAVGSPDRLLRSVDVAGLSTWLAVRRIDRDIVKFDAIERDEFPAPGAVAPVVPVVPTEAPGVATGLQENGPIAPVRPKASTPRPARDTPARDTPARETPARETPARETPARETPAREAPARESPAREAPAREAVAPLPPPIEVRPAPKPAPSSVPPQQPRPGQPLVLTPSLSGPQRAF